MMRRYLTIFLTLVLLTAYGQNCEDWSVGIMTSDTVYLLSKPVDIGEGLVKEKVFLQIMFTQGNYLLIINVKNDAIMPTGKITLKSKTGDLVAKEVAVTTKMLKADGALVITDPAKQPSTKWTYFSDLESKENRFIFFEITPDELENFKKVDFTSFQTTDISIELSKATAKRLKRIIGCII